MSSQHIRLIVKILLTIIVFILLIFKWPDKALVLIAFLAVLVALFKEDIYSFYKPPFLSISVPENLDIGDEVDAKNLETGEFVEKQAYLSGITFQSEITNT